MRSPKLFIILLSICSIILLLAVLPNTFRGKTVSVGGKTIPVGNIVSSFSDIYINAGPLKIDYDFFYSLGLDLEGGTQLTYQLDMKDVKPEEREQAFESARTVIERRVNFFGVGEPVIQNLKIGDEYRIIVELPGVSDVTEATGLIGQTAQLTFWEQSPTLKTPEEATLSAFMEPLGISAIFGSQSAQTDLSGRDLERTNVVFDPNTGVPQVQLEFTQEGAKKFGAITKANLGKPVAIALDNQVISAPVVQQQINTGDAVISGNFTTDEAKNLSIALNAGALPVPLEIIGQTTIGPTLGKSALQTTAFAGLIGFVCTALFMILTYRKLGVLASVALIVYVLLNLLIFKLIPITMTLAGIAGFILSIGMAIDANILIFERTKEELRLGKPKDIALRLGFSRAWSSIRDSNISSLITTVILYYFGTGPIRGFAITLAIGILVSMFSAIVVTKNLIKATEGTTLK